MFSLTSVRGLFSRKAAATASMSNATTTAATRNFSTTSTALARKAPTAVKKTPSKTTTVPKRLRNSGKSENYHRIAILKQNLFSPAPPPLRMARQRWLRHWTIHRAWMMFRRNQNDAIARERQRMHSAMYNACEELRKTKGPGGKDEGYLYRVAMEKKGVWALDTVPIEYARFQTDSPAHKPWDHDWKR